MTFIQYWYQWLTEITRPLQSSCDKSQLASSFCELAPIITQTLINKCFQKFRQRHNYVSRSSPAQNFGHPLLNADKHSRSEDNKGLPSSKRNESLSSVHHIKMFILSCQCRYEYYKHTLKNKDFKNGVS